MEMVKHDLFVLLVNLVLLMQDDIVFALNSAAF
jgi:hypothetical protein